MTSTTPPPSSIIGGCSWLLEKQPHIPQLQLYVHRPAAKLQLSLQPRSIHFKLDDNDSEITVPIDCAIDTALSKLTLRKTVTATLLTLPIIGDGGLSSLSNDDSDEFPTIAELRPVNYRSLHCRHCIDTVANILSVPPSRCLPLPSAHWSELVDLWYCHTEDNRQLDKLSALTVCAKAGVVLVGMHDVRLLQSDISTGAISIDADANTSSTTDTDADTSTEGIRRSKSNKSTQNEYRRLRCSHCHTELGRAVTVRDNQSTNDEIHLFKYRISNVHPSLPDSRDASSQSSLIESLRSMTVKIEPSDNAVSASIPSLFLPYYSIETHFSSLLLARCEARCCYRFRIETADMQRSLALTILNIDTSVRTDTVPSLAVMGGGNDSKYAMCPVIKVAYQVNTGPSVDDSAPTPLTSAANIDSIECSDDDFQSLAALLDDHHRMTPVPFNAFGKMRISFLKKLSRFQ